MNFPKFWITCTLNESVIVDLNYFSLQVTSLLLGRDIRLPQVISDLGYKRQSYILRNLAQRSKRFTSTVISYPKAVQAISDVKTKRLQKSNLPYPFDFVKNENIPQEDKVFLRMLMDLDPGNRPTVKTLLKWKWLRTEA